MGGSIFPAAAVDCRAKPLDSRFPIQQKRSGKIPFCGTASPFLSLFPHDPLQKIAMRPQGFFNFCTFQFFVKSAEYRVGK